MKINENVSSITSAVRKMSALAEERKNCLRSDLGTPNFPTPKHIITATKKALDQGNTQYPAFLGITPLRDAIAKYESKKGVPFEISNVIVTQGGEHAIFLALTGILKPGETVYMIKPHWENYNTIPLTLWAKKETITIKDMLAKKPGKDVKVILINSPNNPSGVIYDKETLQSVAAYAKKYDLFIISDEVYDQIYFEEKPYSIVNYAPERTLIVNAVSKTYSMTGYRIGWLCGPKEFITNIGWAIRSTLSCCNSFAQEGALAALTGDQTCVKKMVAEYKKRRDLMMKRINKIGWECETPQGALYCYPDIKEDSWKFVMELLEKANISAVPGESFGDKTHIRFCFASMTIPEINEGFDRIEKFLKERK